ncbi:MAG: hypothetical protein M9898_04525 [Chitinophagaceae bacterium]|nr:hypothetical protein [Chitinophagaceae bacterium]
MIDFKSSRESFDASLNTRKHYASKSEDWRFVNTLYAFISLTRLPLNDFN